MDAVYDGTVLLVTQTVIVVLLDHATIPLMFEQGSLREVVADPVSGLLLDCEDGLIVTDLPIDAIVH